MSKFENNILTVEDGEKIEAEQFKNKKDIHQILFRGRVEIGDSAFVGCTGITELNIPEGTGIGYRVFRGCTSLTKLIIPRGAKSIGKAAFICCEGIVKLIIAHGVVSINEMAFWYCGSLTSVELPKGLLSIGNLAFASCKRLSSIEFPASVVSIGQAAFSDCEGIEELIIPHGMVSIGERAFWGCKGLISICLPNTLISIGEGVFASCINIATVQIAAGFDLAQLRGKLPGATQVTREKLCFSVGHSPDSIKGKGAMQRSFAKLLFLCGERLARTNEKDTSADNLPTLPPEIWFEIMSWVNIEYVPEKIRPLTSAELDLTDEERVQFSAYKALEKSLITFGSGYLLQKLLNVNHA